MFDCRLSLTSQIFVEQCKWANNEDPGAKVNRLTTCPAGGRLKMQEVAVVFIAFGVPYSLLLNSGNECRYKYFNYKFSLCRTPVINKTSPSGTWRSGPGSFLAKRSADSFNLLFSSVAWYFHFFFARLPLSRPHSWAFIFSFAAFFGRDNTSGSHRDSTGHQIPVPSLVSRKWGAYVLRPPLATSLFYFILFGRSRNCETRSAFEQSANFSWARLFFAAPSTRLVSHSKIYDFFLKLISNHWPAILASKMYTSVQIIVSIDLCRNPFLIEKSRFWIELKILHNFHVILLLLLINICPWFCFD